MLHVITLKTWFEDQFKDIDVEFAVKMYVIDLCSMYKSNNYDLCDKSIVEMYAEASKNANFKLYQSIGDYVLWATIFVPESLKNNRDISEYFAKKSYMSCFNMTKNKYDVYKVLSIDFRKISDSCKSAIGKNHVKSVSL